QDNLVFVKRPGWIVEGQSSDPYYNFGKVIMYFDREMYRIYWKLVHNRAGEYFYTAACGYHFVKNDDTFSAVFPSLVIGVNDKINRAAIGGRYQSSYIERNWDPSYFSLRTLTHMSDWAASAARDARPAPCYRVGREAGRGGPRASRPLGIGVRRGVLQRRRAAPEHERARARLRET